MYIKFIKRHKVGIDKNEVRSLQERQALKMINEKYAEEITKEEYDELREATIKLVQDRVEEMNTNADEKNGKAEEESEARSEEHQKKKLKIVGASSVKKEDKKIPDNRPFHKVTQKDLDNNPDMVSRHLKVDDEILLDVEGGNPVKTMDDGSYIGREGKLGKDLPSSEETSSEDSKKSETDGGGASDSTGTTGTSDEETKEDPKSEDPPAEESKSEDETPKVKYHALTKEDIEQNKLDDKEWKVGDEVQILDDGDFVVDDKENLIRKESK